MADATTDVLPGWYDDGQGNHRWFDGTEWLQTRDAANGRASGWYQDDSGKFRWFNGDTWGHYYDGPEAAESVSAEDAPASAEVPAAAEIAADPDPAGPVAAVAQTSPPSAIAQLLGGTAPEAVALAPVAPEPAPSPGVGTVPALPPTAAVPSATPASILPVSVPAALVRPGHASSDSVVVRRRRISFVPPGREDTRGSDVVVSRDWAAGLKGAKAHDTSLPRNRKIAGELPAWAPLPPGELVVNRRTSL